MEHISFEEINTRTIPRRPHTPPSCAPVNSLGDPPSLDSPLPVLCQGSLWHFGTRTQLTGYCKRVFCLFLFLNMVIHAKEGENKPLIHIPSVGVSIYPLPLCEPSDQTVLRALERPKHSNLPYSCLCQPMLTELTEWTELTELTELTDSLS